MSSIAVPTRMAGSPAIRPMTSGVRRPASRLPTNKAPKPAGGPGVRAAASVSSGDSTEVPSPAMKNPTSARLTPGEFALSTSPAPEMTVAARKTVVRPNASARWSPASRPSVMPAATEKKAKAAAVRLLPRSSVIRKVAHSPGTTSSGTITAAAAASSRAGPTRRVRSGRWPPPSDRPVGVVASVVSKSGPTRVRAAISTPASRHKCTVTSMPAASTPAASSPPPSVPRL